MTPSERGTVSIVTVAHDDDCALLTIGGTCNCNPDIRITRQDGSEVKVLKDGTTRPVRTNS